jgi:hypothetical protein
MPKKPTVQETCKSCRFLMLDSAVIYYRDNIMRISGLQQQGLPPNRYVMQTWHIEVLAVYYCTGEALRHKLVEGKPPNYNWMDEVIAKSIPPHKRGKKI